MTARYVLTSVCVQTGTMALTASLRQRLLGRERIRLVDEDGEVYEAEVDWKASVVRGVGPYYAKRRLGANEAILLHFRGEEIELKALPRAPVRTPIPEKPQAQEKPGPQKLQEKPRKHQGKAEAQGLQELREKPKEPREKPREEVKGVREKRVRVGTATAATTSFSSNETLLSPEPKAPPKALHPPGATEDLGRLGFFLEGGPPWVYKATLRRRQVVLTLLRLGEGELSSLKPHRQRGAYVALLAPESEKASVPKEVGFVSPEALSRLARFRAHFPITPLDLENLLRGGRVDLEAVEELEDRLAAELYERGTFAAFLLFLSRRKLGEVLLLSDLEAEALEEGFGPEAVRQSVELLAKPPFLVLKRSGPGEFLLRQEVGQALDDLRAFAESLKARLNRVSVREQNGVGARPLE
jgi:hypothetical protein